MTDTPHFGKERLKKDAFAYVIDHFPDVTIRRADGSIFAYTKADAERMLDVFLIDASNNEVDAMIRHDVIFIERYAEAVRKDFEALLPKGANNDLAHRTLLATLEYFKRSYREKGDDAIWREQIGEIIPGLGEQNVYKFYPSKKRPR